MDDLTGAMRDAAQRIAELERQLDAARSEFSRLSSRLSHDLQAILQNIDGFAAVLEEAAADRLSPQQARYLGRVRHGAGQGQALLRDLRTLSGIAMAELQPQPVDLDRLVRHAIDDLRPAAAGRAVEWAVSVAPGPAPVADPFILKLAIDHLAGNALKFTRGRAPARIGISASADEAGWALTVQDNGAGFDPRHQQRLFTAFERLHGSAEFEGNGLGLAIVKAVADRHGGRVQARSGDGEGATFTLVLPLQPAPQPGRATPAPAATPGTVAAPRLRVLIADDEPLVLATLKAMLERDGHEVAAAADGSAACRLLGEHAARSARFDLLISDWLMPGIDGPQLAQAARQLSPGTRVLLLTGQRTGADGQHAVPPGVDRVLAKPVRAPALKAAIESVRAAQPPGR